MNRVEIVRPWAGVYHMLVCVAPNVTDDEILDVCNRENSAGTTGGWMRVRHEQAATCDEDPQRTHFLVAC